MTLLECLIGIALCALLLNPLLRTSADLVIKQIEYEKTQALISEADRAFELIGRAIRIAGHQNLKPTESLTSILGSKESSADSYLKIQKGMGYKKSDVLTIQYELSNGVDYDCIGNVITKERTRNHLALQGFLVNHQAGIPKGQKVNGGSLICQSLDRQGKIQNTTLMNGINGFFIEEVISPQAQSVKGQKLFRIKLKMTDGAKLNLDFERSFSTRNL